MVQTVIEHYLNLGKTTLKKVTGALLDNPIYALTELITNAWDAGATRVDITWPDAPEKEFKIEDNGIGIPENEFDKRWSEINYERKVHQGENVVFPSNLQLHRKAFGKNGIGRFSLLCFTNSYFVESKNNGWAVKYKFTYNPEQDGNMKKEIIRRTEIDKTNTGLIISGTIKKNYITTNDIEEQILIRFTYDPNFSVYLNSKKFDLESEDIIAEHEVQTPYGPIQIRLIDTKKGRRKKSSGIIFWVNGKAVGTPKWRLGTIKFEDGKNAAGRQLLFIVNANYLHRIVKDDWSGFEESEQEYIDTVEIIAPIIRKEINELTKQSRNEKKTEYFSSKREVLKTLPLYDIIKIEKIWDKIRQNSAINYDNLNDIVDLIIDMSKNESMSSIFQRLSKLEKEQISEIDELIKYWHDIDFLIKSKIMNERALIFGYLYEFSNHYNDSLPKIAALLGKNPWIFGDQWDFQGLLPYDVLYNYLLTKLSVINKTPLQRKVDYNYISWNGFYISLYSDIINRNTQGFIEPQNILVLILEDGEKSKEDIINIISLIETCIQNFITHTHLENVCFSVIMKDSNSIFEYKREEDKRIEIRIQTFSDLVQQSFKHFSILRQVMEQSNRIKSNILNTLINNSLDRFLDVPQEGSDGLKYLASIIINEEISPEIDMLSEANDKDGNEMVYSVIEKK